MPEADPAPKNGGRLVQDVLPLPVLVDPEVVVDASLKEDRAADRAREQGPAPGISSH